MTEALFRIPSRTVKYGWVQLPVEVTPDASPEMLAAQYVNYVHAFQKEEEATIARLLEGSSRPPEAPLAASQAEVDHPVDPVDKAAQMVAEGLGGATEVDGYGGIEGDALYNEAAKAPWEQDLARKSKPWETDAKPVVTEDW